MGKSPPNILWIVTTQWRGQSCGYAGDPNVRTPRIDALAAYSVNYTQAVTPHPFGPMARAALLTGVPSPENGVKDYFDMLPMGARTVAHDLRERGYTTAFFGKWGVGKRDPAVPLVGEAAAKVVVPPEERGGFEFWEGFEGGFVLNDPWLHGTRKGLAEPVRFTGYQPHVLHDQFHDACLFGPLAGRAPWFSVISIETPHPPYGAAPPGSGAGPAEGSLELRPNVPRGGATEERARRELSGYIRDINETDRAIGALIDTADLFGGDRGCVVIFTSVHGDMHGSHGLFRKGWPHDESVRVPLLVREPCVGARRDESAISILDLPAMTRGCADRCAPKLAGGKVFTRISMPSVVALPQQCDRVWRGVRSSTRKLVLNEDGTPWLFFDLERDPFEIKNLAGEPARQGEIEAISSQVG